MRNPTPLAKDDALALAPGATCHKLIDAQYYEVRRENGELIALAPNAALAWRRALERLKREVGQK